MHRVLITASLVLVAGTSAYMSVCGLMSVFSGNAKVIMCMGLGMEIGKLMIVTYLYRKWRELIAFTRILYILIVFVLVLLTSVEVIGFLSQSHVSATRDLRISEAVIRSVMREATILEDQLRVTDATLKGLPISYVSRRIKERKASGYNGKQARLLKIAKEQARLETGIIKAKESAGPIFAVAQIMEINGTDAVAGLILLLVLVLEPLSIGLTVAATAAWLSRKNPPKIKTKRSTSTEELNEIQEKFGLTVPQLAKITGRKKPKTCEGWLNGKTAVPLRALRAVRAWADRQNHAPSQ